MPDRTTSPKKAPAWVVEAARTVITHIPSMSQAAYEADLASVERLLTDQPDLRDRVNTGATGDLTPDQVRVMARLHASSSGSVASSTRLTTEVDRYLKESGMF